MIIRIFGNYYALISLSQPMVPVIEFNENDMECVIECPYCGKRTTVGKSLMICGFVGCPNCFWKEDGLMKTVIELKKHNYEEYSKGEFYRKGYKNWRVHNE